MILTLNKQKQLTTKFLIDILSLVFLFAVNSVEDFNVLIKLATSILVLGLVIVRIYYFIKEKKNINGKNGSR